MSFGGEHATVGGLTGRDGASMAYDSATGQMVLFGGVGGGSSSHSTWTWDGTAWTERSTPDSPPAFGNPSMAYDAATSQLVLVGESTEGGSAHQTWTYGIPSHLRTNWTLAAPATSPPARNGAAMAFDSATGQMVLFGGVGESGYLSAFHFAALG